MTIRRGMLVFLGLTSIAVAQDQDPGKSIMFGDQQADYGHLTTLPEDQHKDRGDRCMEMLQEAERLKGKPQRRSVAMERYRAECERP